MSRILVLLIFSTISACSGLKLKKNKQNKESYEVDVSCYELSTCYQKAYNKCYGDFYLLDNYTRKKVGIEQDVYDQQIIRVECFKSIDELKKSERLYKYHQLTI